MKDICNETQRIRQSFSRGLSSYHDAAVAQACIAGDLAAALAQTTPERHFQNALEFGVGTGHLTQALQEQFTFETMWRNDLVPECGAGKHFVAGPIEAIPLPDKLDLIASASTVQWVTNHPALLARLSGHLKPDGLMSISGFGIAQFQELQALGSQAAAPNYADASRFADALPSEMEVLYLHQEQRVMWFDNALSLLRHLRRTGVNGRACGNWTRARLLQFETRYSEQFGRDGKLPLTYDPVWLVARKR